MLLLVVALIVPALGARPGFTDTGSLEWRDCGVGDSWVSVKQFDIKPSPIVIPGDMTVSLDGTISHDVTDQVTLDALVEKKLLDRFWKVPCHGSFAIGSTSLLLGFITTGSCHYTDPCHFLDTFKEQGTCPPQLTANGIPCTCPFSPEKLRLPTTKFTVTNAWRFLTDGEYHIKITMNDKHTKQLRGCFETYLNIDV